MEFCVVDLLAFIEVDGDHLVGQVVDRNESAFKGIVCLTIGVEHIASKASLHYRE